MRQAGAVTIEMTRGDRQSFSRASYGQHLHQVSFAGQDLTSVSIPRLLWLERCSFDGADLRQATLDGMHLKLCTLKDANLRGASLRGVSFTGCDLTGADLRDADLHGASFGAVNTGNSSGRTVLSGALLDQAALVDAEVDASTVLPED
ncbi:pentapeptide repeat protein [Kineococcus radiotolerans SRS30216 = ATCC BAA-149]|uniref:Pentapeptide repeat protein n=1 Tax=Kineococcus radiotolerans (strain ATCC BAA-149 / DSM 14245 / SRS30216) TaxID=266940 RepID=A6WAJ1_KINRD|nr:pentapeptide repeat protein [Kineococcus radiotolerans SRS30216 = ATCC BAA-149]